MDDLERVVGRIEHIGIAVGKLDAAVAFYRDVLGLELAHREVLEADGLEEVLFRVGDVYIQLLASTDGAGPVAEFVERHGEGVHHLAFSTPNVHAALARLAQDGIAADAGWPRVGGRGHLVAFVSPPAGGVKVELVEKSGS